jgi:hypothetical protein
MPNFYRKYILKITNIGFTEKFLLWYYLYYTVILMDIALSRKGTMPTPGLPMATAIVLVVLA